ncbi:hypothetical protein [Streptomyces pini]|uniref:Phage-related protein n=1 Tax=Streptomyces pini TaxID=1520580 RepID=A0A1I3U4S2_9ACTN|nr:hypothetical protein [Streptomyces pini]SFJ76791.1 hypothetical protein SAMN05192584_101226 [Streptomyces pini]
MPLNQLTAARPAFTGFGGALGQARAGLAANTRAVRAAQRAAAAVRGSAQRSAAELRRTLPAAGAAGQGLAGLGRRAGAAHPQLTAARPKAAAANRELKRIRSGAARAATLSGGISKGAGLFGRLGGVFGVGLRLGAGVMKLVNTVMKANPWGLALSLVAPLVLYLVDAAARSEAGQRIVQQGSAALMQGVRTVAKVIEPAVRTVVKIATGYVRGYLTVVTAVVKWLASMVRDPMGTLRRTVSSAGGALRSIAGRTMGRIRGAVRSALNWLTTGPRRMFDRVAGATRRVLGGIAGFLESGMQLVLHVLKAPINGLIAFANWLIDGLNSLSVSVLGKKFGVNISRIPQLAAGGVALPRRGGVPAVVAEAGEAEAVLPLPALRRLMDRAARHTASARMRGGRIEHYTEPAERGPLGVADDLLFLARTAHPAQPGAAVPAAEAIAGTGAAP